jgi:hypothetical protein
MFFRLCGWDVCFNLLMAFVAHSYILLLEMIAFGGNAK